MGCRAGGCWWVDALMREENGERALRWDMGMDMGDGDGGRWVYVQLPLWIFLLNIQGGFEKNGWS